MSLNKEKILITGGSGFIGSHLTAYLLSQGFQITLLSSGKSLDNLGTNRDHSKLNIVTLNLQEEVDFQPLLQDIDIVIHLYWNSIPRKEAASIYKELDDSLLSSLRLLEACAKANISKFIFPSSGGAVYGLKHQFPIEEESGLKPISYYGLTKSIFEQYLHYYHHLYKLNYSILRLANVYGPKQNLKINQGVISHWLRDILLEQRITLYGSEKITRDYIFISDVITAFHKIILNEDPATIYNISSGEGTSLGDIIHMLKDELKLDFSLKKIEGYETDVPINILSNTKAKEELNWKPIVGLNEGIRQTHKFLSDNLT